MKKTIWIVLFACLTFPLTSYSIPFNGSVSFDTGMPTMVIAGDAKTNVNVTVDFGTTFAFIDSLVFRFQFDDDLFDPGDQFQISNFVSPDGSRSAFAAKNISLNAAVGPSFALIGAGHPPVDLFLDGIESFVFSMLSGSVLLTNIQVIANVNENNIKSVDEPSTLILLSLGLLLVVFINKVHQRKALSSFA